MKKNKNMAKAVTLSLLLAGTLGVSVPTQAADLVIDSEETYKNLFNTISTDGWTIVEYFERTGTSSLYNTNSYSDNNVTIDYNNINNFSVFGGLNDKDADVDVCRNIVKIINTSDGTSQNTPKFAIICGGMSDYSKVEGNKVIIEGKIKRSDEVGGYPYLTIWGGYSNYGEILGNEVIIKAGDFDNLAEIYGGQSYGNVVEGNSVEISGSVSMDGSKVVGGSSQGLYVKNNTVTIDGNNDVSMSGVHIIGGESRTNDSSIQNNVVIISGGTVNGNIYGGYGIGKNNNFTKNEVVINGGEIEGDVYGAYSNTNYGTVSDITENKIKISGTAKIEKADLFGYESSGNIEGIVKDNALIIDNWSGAVNSLNNFDNITFSNINWDNGKTIITINNDKMSSNLSKTDVKIEKISFAGGSDITSGESMTLIDNKGDTNGFKYGEEIPSNSEWILAAGVALNLEGFVKADTDDAGSKLVYTVKEKKINDQVNILTENYAVAAAFVNQGSDLITDALQGLQADNGYGVKTFAVVHGNHSKYDVNSDLKINGWSSLVGVGNELKYNSGDLSWGVFYENGSGNYRTYNSFNDDFFRGDGSLVYNGGGAAVRYDGNDGVYVEGSLRAGMLKNQMSNALHEANGTAHGYKTESNYYGVHLGGGKIIELDESRDLDVYGKFFHTYTEGDKVTVAGDKFDFDGIKSDRLRIGARLVTNKANKWSTYYGVAWEYEFNGEADMRAQNVAAPTQSLQGSTYMGEVGVNFVPSNDSPWSFDAKVRGYAGERQGFSGNIQAVYSF